MGFLELLLLSFLAFLLFGPKKTPELARKLGSTIGQFNCATNDLQTKLVSEATSILPQRRASIDATFAAWTRSIVAAPPAVHLLAAGFLSTFNIFLMPS